MEVVNLYLQQRCDKGEQSNYKIHDTLTSVFVDEMYECCKNLINNEEDDIEELRETQLILSRTFVSQISEGRIEGDNIREVAKSIERFNHLS